MRPSAGGRRLQGVVLCVLWILLCVAYSAPLWLPGFVSLDFAVSVEPPGRTWMAVVLVAVMLLAPPILLSVLTIRWLRGRRRR